MPRRPAPVGSHISVAGGLHRATARAAAVGAEVMQVFVANPRGWANPPADPDADAGFGATCAAAGIPVFVHAPYLINFGSPSVETLTRSTLALEFSLRRGTAIGAAGVVVHAGSAVLGNRWDDAMAQVGVAVLPLLDSLPGAPRLLIEPTAGGGGALAADAATLAQYLDVLGRDERIGVCLDTCHMHAAGHDLSSPEGFLAALAAYGRATGPRGIGLVHVNDSRDPAGSKRDRHESPGKGTIGPEPFAALFTSPATRSVPKVVETNDDAQADDIAALKAWRSQARR